MPDERTFALELRTEARQQTRLAAPGCALQKQNTSSRTSPQVPEAE